MSSKDAFKLLDGIFIFSLVWSIGASTENEGRGKFSGFLRKLLKKEVDPSPERNDFDLGPGLEISDPGFMLEVSMPAVSISIIFYLSQKNGCCIEW